MNHPVIAALVLTVIIVLLGWYILRKAEDDAKEMEPHWTPDRMVPQDREEQG